MICLCKHACCPFASVSSYSGLTDVHAQDLLLLPAISNFGFMVSQDQQTTLQSSHQDAQQQSLMSVPICPAVMPQENTINCGLHMYAISCMGCSGQLSHLCRYKLQWQAQDGVMCQRMCCEHYRRHTSSASSRMLVRTQLQGQDPPPQVLVLN